MMMVSVPRRLASLLLVGVATRAAAQEQASAPSCDGRAPEAAPCRAHYDTAPVLDPASQPPLPAGEPRKPLVWVYVDETGVVRRAQVHQPAGGVDWDIAARYRARQFRFQPATLAGRPVGAWVLMPIAAVPPPASCAASGMSVPLSAGALFADSAVLDRPELGTRFRYTADGFGIDLFVYPHVRGETPQAEVDRTLAAFQQGAVQAGPGAIRLVRAGAERVRPSRRFRDAEFDGYSAVYRARLDGSAVESYVAVFPAGDEDLEVRATYPPGGAARRQVAEFVQQLLSHRAWRMKGCPR
jgi:hypothetical protein